MPEFSYILIIVLLTWNILTFALYGIDKAKAKRGSQRIKEATLILVAYAMGGLGALLGMSVFRHKTRKTVFRVLVPLAFVLNFVVLVVLHMYFGVTLLPLL